MPLKCWTTSCRNTGTRSAADVNYACGKDLLKPIGIPTHRPSLFWCRERFLSHSGWVCNLHIKAQHLFRTGCLQTALCSVVRSPPGLPLLGSTICHLPTISQASWFKDRKPAQTEVGERGLIGLHNWEAQGPSGPSQPVPAHSLVSSTALLSLCSCQTASLPGPSARPMRTYLPITEDAAQAPPSTLTDFYSFLSHH